MVKVTLWPQSGRDIERITWPTAKTARYERDGHGSTFLILRDEANRLVASLPQSRVIDIHAPDDP
jgi:hypothetical protein